MGLIRHNYINIINIDHLDVHPPLYYLLLKLFLQITTFWNKSLFIKVIFARLFSILIGIIGFYFLHKIIKKCGINLNWKFQLICYLLIPSIMNYFTTIRMYELASLFIILECYELSTSFNNKNNTLNISLSVIFALLASYTHYYAAVSAGILLFTFFITSICYYNDKKSSIKYFLSGIFYFVLYLPIILFVKNQFMYNSSVNEGYNYLFHQIIGAFVGIVNSNGTLRLIFIFLILLGFIYLIVWSFHNINNKFNIVFTNILTDLLFTMLFGIIMSIIKGTPFTARYTYPIFSVYAFFIISIFCLILKKYFYNKIILNNIVKVLFICMCCFILFSSIKTIKTNLVSFDKPSISLVHNMKKWKTSSNKNINVYLNTYPTIFQKPLYITQSIVYLNSINKNVCIDKKDMSSIRMGTLAHNNEKLFNKVFGNTVIK